MPAREPVTAMSSDRPSQDLEERVARGVVADHRARLDWLLRVPEWSGLYDAGVAALGLPGRRQGIRLEAALGALAIEHKYQLVRWVAERFRRHLGREVAQQLCRVVGVERFNIVDLDSLLTARQWTRLREAMLFRLSREHLRYKHAQHLLFINHRHLVDRVVAQVVFSARHRADCEQEGAMGLLQAIDRVQVEGEFSAYCLTWIRRAVRNHLVRQRLPVHAPVNLVVRATALRGREDAQRDGSAGGAGPETPLEDSGRLETVLLELLRHPAVSLDEPAAADDRVTVADTLVDAGAEDPLEAAARTDLREAVDRLMGALTDKQREVLVHRYGLLGTAPRSLSEIARRAGISHQQASMRERRALQRLESALEPVVSEYHGDF